MSSSSYDLVDEILTGMSYEEIKTLKAASLSFEWVAMTDGSTSLGRLPIGPLEQHLRSALVSLHIRENYYYPHDHFINIIHSLIAFLAHPASRKLETLTVEAGVDMTTASLP
ncbi:hypothetical protein K438DRAFT_1961546 [Mycena galopus ATCC 62051]|nr:hypothetical protein K438DRAFT_1961546 [Mycena galopus ATCC 62051]